MNYKLLPDEHSAYLNKYKNLEKEYADAGSAIGEAAGLSCDWHDNFGFDDAQRSFGVIGEKLAKINAILSESNVIDTNKINEKIVSVGTTITISIDEGEPVTYQIGGFETPIKGRVSYNAPIIKPLLGKEEGDIVEIMLHEKQKEIEIIKITKM